MKELTFLTGVSFHLFSLFECFLHLHAAGNGIPLTEYFVQVFCPKDVPQGGLGQQPGGVVGVLHVGHADRGVADPVVDHGVHRDRHRVLGQNLGK